MAFAEALAEYIEYLEPTLTSWGVHEL
jgi:hypothetical protein